jgi:hypothetical protein
VGLLNVPVQSDSVNHDLVRSLYLGSFNISIQLCRLLQTSHTTPCCTRLSKP